MNTISYRIYDFLKKFPPFDLFSKEELISVTSKVKVVYLQKSKVLFKQGDLPHDFFYILKEGKVLLKKDDKNPFDSESLVEVNIDICDEGELFGLRPLIAKDDYLMTAIAEEESIVYAIPIYIFKPLLQSNPKVGFHIVESFASKTKNPYYSDYLSNMNDSYQKSNRELVHNIQVVDYKKSIVTTFEDTKAQEVALLMENKKVRSVVIIKDNLPIGIITDKDLRSKIVTGLFPIDAPANKIMSSPIKTFKEGMTITEAQLNMLKYKVDYLCITKDGTSKTRVIGMITERDLIAKQGHTVNGLVKAIERSSKPKELKNIRFKVYSLLKNYIYNDIPMSLIFGVIHEINESLVQCAIKLAIKKMREEPPVKFSWLSMGSHGRKEQFLLTDQDNAIVFEDVPEDEYEKVKSYFLKMAMRVNKTLKKIGYEYCPADMMAKNPRWCNSLSEWKQKFFEWINKPVSESILMSSIFLDYTCTYGDKGMVLEISEDIKKYTENNSLFFMRLAEFALERTPPLGFFKQFLVEHNGEHKNSLDIKSRAIMPLVDIARLLVYSKKNGNRDSSTAFRFEQMAEIEPQNKELYLSGSYAIKALLRFRTKHGLLYNDSGRYIKLDELTKEERIKLKKCFKVILRIQELVKIRFR